MRMLFLITLVILMAASVAAQQANSSSFSVEKSHLGLAGGNSSSSSFGLRWTSTYQQGSNHNVAGSTKSLNSGWFNLVTSAVTTKTQTATVGGGGSNSYTRMICTDCDLPVTAETRTALLNKPQEKKANPVVYQKGRMEKPVTQYATDERALAEVESRSIKNVRTSVAVLLGVIGIAMILAINAHLVTPRNSIRKELHGELKGMEEYAKQLRERHRK